MRNWLRRSTPLLLQNLQAYFRFSYQWLLETPARALSEAYQAAQDIQNIENLHFQGNKISASSDGHTVNMTSYWVGFLNKKLTIIQLRLAEFRLSRSLLNISNQSFIERLIVIDEILYRYKERREYISVNAIVLDSDQQINSSGEPEKEIYLSDLEEMRVEPVFAKTGLFPGSIGRTIRGIGKDFDPKAEEKFIRDFRISSGRTRIAARFLIMLIVVPLLTQQLSKQFLILPILSQIKTENLPIFLNYQMEDEALHELKIFEAKIKFQNLIYRTPSLSLQAMTEQLTEKALEIAEDFQSKTRNSISNIFASVLSFIAFGFVVSTSKREIEVVKSFIDGVVYGLSDSAKAFLIILFTDIFVGFHSPHGWEVLLEYLAESFGLPANRNAMFLFIATFPVILDTIFKYWIFRYLSRLSPSALATLKEMNE